MASKDIKPEKPAGKGETSRGKGAPGGIERKTMMKLRRKSMMKFWRKSM